MRATVKSISPVPALALALVLIPVLILISVPVFSGVLAPSPVYASGGSESDVVYTNPSTGFQIVIRDDCDLLSDDEESKLMADMIPLTEYGNVGFFSSDAANPSTARYSEQIYRSYFNSDDGTIFLIDMYNRIIQVTSGGRVYRIITKSYANTITDNVYRYASRGEYYECARRIYSQELTLLQGGKIARPMKHITNLLVAVTLALLINYVIVLIQRRKTDAITRRSSHIPASTTLATIGGIALVKERRYRYSESSGGSSGGGGGGFSGGGGGGSSGGGGGGGSVGGGGHSF